MYVQVNKVVDDNLQLYELSLDKMKFTLSSFTGHLIIYPYDFILRLEHAETSRVYEHEFIEPDFSEIQYVSDMYEISNIEFVGRLLSCAIQKTPQQGLQLKVTSETATSITLTLTYTPQLLLSKPIVIKLELPATEHSNNNVCEGCQREVCWNCVFTHPSNTLSFWTSFKLRFQRIIRRGFRKL